MTHGLIVYKPNGAVAWDSRNVIGVLFADTLDLAANQSGVLSYPQFPGATVSISTQLPTDTTSTGVTTDTALGYPRVTAAPINSRRKFNVIIEL